MRLVDETERIVLLVVAGVPALIILAWAGLDLLNANPDNRIVELSAAAADQAIPDVLGTLLNDQEVWQTAALGLLPWGVAALVIVLVFRWIRAAVLQIQQPRAGRRPPPA